MGFIVWYQLTFLAEEGGAKLFTVSNDVLAGDFVVDADVATSAMIGPHTATFDLTLHDLPMEAVNKLVEQHRASNGGKPVLVDIRLGYFDQPATKQKPVMLGALTELRTEVNGLGELLTTMHGEELAGYRLLRKPVAYHRPGVASLTDILNDLKAKIEVPIVFGADITGERRDYTIRTGNALKALEGVATDLGKPLAVLDGQALLGDKASAGLPARFAPDSNLVCQDRRDDHVRPNLLLAPEAKPVSGYAFTVLGDPGLRIGQKVTAHGDAEELTVVAVRHDLRLTNGYVCEVEAVTGPLTPDAGRPSTGPGAFVDGLDRRIRTVLADRPAVQVGDVSAYRPGGDGGEGGHGGHRATLMFGQNAPPEGVTASVDGPVDEDVLLHDKPLASPFAWDRCGLVVPVYEGMRALLVHNGGEVNDAVGAGFVWSRHAGHAAPANQPGDYWLCLPTEMVNGRPAGKGVNDLTDATGHRVIQTRGLAIDVGAGRLPDVGTRPTTLPPDGALVISHASGTTITVAADGAVTIQTDGKDIALGNGQASITISGTSIALAAASVEVG